MCLEKVTHIFVLFPLLLLFFSFWQILATLVGARNRLLLKTKKLELDTE